MWLPDEGRIQPLTLLAHLARQARAAGYSWPGRVCGRLWRGARPVLSRGHSGPSSWQIRLAAGQLVRARSLISAVARPRSPMPALRPLIRAELPETFPLFWDASPMPTPISALALAA